MQTLGPVPPAPRLNNRRAHGISPRRRQDTLSGPNQSREKSRGAAFKVRERQDVLAGIQAITRMSSSQILAGLAGSEIAWWRSRLWWGESKATGRPFRCQYDACCRKANRRGTPRRAPGWPFTINRGAPLDNPPYVSGSLPDSPPRADVTRANRADTIMIKTKPLGTRCCME